MADASGGVAVVNIGNSTTGGTFNTGTGITTIAGTGQINLNGGAFNLNGGLTVTGGSFTQTGGTFTWAASQTMTIQSAGNVTLIGSYTTPTNANITITGNSSILSDTGPIARLTIDNGTAVSVTAGGSLHSDQFLNIGQSGNATVTVDGANSSLSSGTAQSILGNVGNGSLTFSNSSTGNIGFLQIGSQAGSTGTLNVQSSATVTLGSLSIAPNAATASGIVNVIGGTITQTGASALTVGAASASSATMNLGNATAVGNFTTGTGNTSINATGKINLTGGAFTANGNITVTGGSFTQTGGTFTWAGSKTMTIQSGGMVTLAGLYLTPTNAVINISGNGSTLENTGTNAIRVVNGATVSVTSGGTLKGDNFLNIGFGTVTIDGSGSSFSTAAPVSSGENVIGNSGNSSTVTFSNQATGSVTSGFLLGLTDGSSGTLNVQSSATLTSGPLDVADSSVSVGVVNVVGGTLTQSGSSYLAVGQPAGGTATVNIGNPTTGAIFTTGTGLTTINATGKLNLNEGTFNLNGGLTVTGGAFTQTGGLFTWAASQTMTIQSGGNVSLPGAFFTPTSATINVTGLNSELNNTGSSAELGIVSGSTLSVTSGGTVNCNEYLLIDQGTVTVDGVGSSLTASASAGDGQTLLGIGGTGSLTFSNSAIGSVGNGFLLGVNSGSSGTLNVQSSASLTTGPLDIVDQGNASTGVINVTGGTLIQSGNATLTVGQASGGSATITVGSATTGGTFTAGTGLATINATGKINLLAGAFNANGNITVTGGAFTQTGGSFTWASARTMTIQSGGNVTLDGFFGFPSNANVTVTGTGSQLNVTGISAQADLEIANSSALSVVSGGSVHSDQFLYVGDNGSGAVTVDGANSSLTAPAGQTYVGLTGNGILTFRNGASGTLGAIGIGTGAGAGVLDVFSSAALAVGNVNIAYIGLAPAGTINVIGGTVTQSGTSTLTLGQASGGTAVVTIASSGNFTTGTGLTTINKTGQITIGLGSFNAKGDITVNGGALTQSFGSFTWAASHTMAISSGGNVTLVGAYITPANSNTTITGAGSILNITGSSCELGIDHGANLSISSGGAAHSAQYLSIADTGNGNVTVDGANSSLSAAVSAANGSNSLGTVGIGLLTFSNSATGSLPGGLQIGGSTGSIGILNVNSNASLTTGPISVADSGLSAIGIVTITGGTVTQTGNATLVVGDLTGNHAGAATLTIGIFGTLSTGSGPISIAPTGTLNDQSGGNFLISGNLTNAGNLILAGNYSAAPNTTLTNTAGGKTTFISNGKLPGLAITGGTVDTTSAKLIIEAATNKTAILAALQADLTNHSLTSSTLAANFGLAVVDNAALATHFTFFGGNPADTNSILIAPELLGDANIDGHVDLNDLNTVLNHLGTTTANWTDGNFDHAATIDLNDLNDVLNNLGVNNANNGTVIAAEALLQASPDTPIPEPATLALSATGAALLAAKRRRR